MPNKYFKYKPSICKRCNKEYRRTSGKQKFCSRECNRKEFWDYVLTNEYKKVNDKYLSKKLERRYYWLNKYRITKGCSLCSYNKSACALDFNHIDPTTKIFSPMVGIRGSLKRLFTEIRKCEILCANCHREKTHEHRNLAKLGRQFKRDIQ